MGRFVLKLIVIFMCWTSSFASSYASNDINTYVLNATKSYMDADTSPCDLFHSYACRNWAKNSGYDQALEIPDVAHTWGYMYNSELKKMLEDDTITKSDKSETKAIFNKLNDFYGTCKKHKDQISDEPYIDNFTPTDEDDWPQFGESWNPKENWSVWKTMGRLAQYGFNNLLVNFHLEQNNDMQSYTATFEPYRISTGQKTFVHEQAANTTNKEAVAMLKKVSKFMSDISHIFRDTRYHEVMAVVETNMDELKKLYKNMDMYLSAFIEEGHIKGVQIKNPQYCEKLLQLIDDTPQDVLIHVLKQSFKYYLSSVLPNKMTDIACVDLLRESVPLALEFMYEQEIYSHQKEQKEAVFKRIFLELQTKLASIIRTEHKDLSKEQIVDYAEKSLKMKLKFGRLPQVVDDQVYVDYFQSWEVINDNFYLNHLNSLKRQHFDSRELLKFDKFESLRQFQGLAKTIPSYIPTSNVVVIPFAYTFHTLLDPDVHELFLYADIGSSLARAMLHGFNLNGVKYDKDGVIFNRCSSDDLSTCQPSNLEEGNQCLLKNYDMDFIRREQQIADFSGFRIAYHTYFQSAKYSKFSPDPELSDKQLFAIQFGQTFCYNQNYDYNDSYGPPNQRLMDITDNSPVFNKIFSCGDDVKKVCQIW